MNELELQLCRRAYFAFTFAIIIIYIYIYTVDYKVYFKSHTDVQNSKLTSQHSQHDSQFKTHPSQLSIIYKLITQNSLHIEYKKMYVTILITLCH